MPSGSVESAPPRGVPLGWRLGLTASVIVVVVLGGLSSWQQWREIRRWRRDRRELLAESLAPLVPEIESATSLDEVRTVLAAFEAAYARAEHPRNRVDLIDDSGSVIATSREGTPFGPRDRVLTASARVRSPLLSRHTGRLVVRQDSSRFEQAVAEAWRLEGLAIGATVACLLTGLLLANHFLIARPLARLVRAVDRMERGYRQELEDVAGAWEIRWLAFRFHNLGSRLEEAVDRWVDAERRSRRFRSDPRGHPVGLAATPLSPPMEATATPCETRARLERLCRLLESADPAGTASLSLARNAWRVSVAEADRLGDHHLKTRIENAALRILEPRSYDRLSRQLQAFMDHHRRWIATQEALLGEALERHGVRAVAIQHRIKQVAALWRKTRLKNLGLSQVQDIVAFRVIVRDTDACYGALRALHENFQPQLLRFKDYIAHPKRNGYQSLHTAIRGEDGPIFEVQIRSIEMHLEAEHGRAAHWSYAEAQMARIGFERGEKARWRRLKTIVLRLRRTLPQRPIGRRRSED